MVRSQANPSPPPRSNTPLKAWTGYRSNHRQKSHDDAHADASAPLPPNLVDHGRVPDNAPELVCDDARLASLLDELRDAGEIAYDTEFIGEQTYFPHLCLIQVATADRVTLIDPLSKVDLAPFWQLLADPGVTTVVHAGLQDLGPILRGAGRPVGRVFDTQLAAGFCGMDYPISLAKLVDALIGGDLNQGPKFSRWDQRPLTPLQKSYAANDVRYLLLLRRRVEARASDMGNRDALAEELDALRDPALQGGPPPLEKLKAKGVAQLSRRRRTVLLALVDWRDHAARRLDMPPRAVMGDDVLVALACDRPADAAALHETRGLPRPVKEQFTLELLEAIRAGEAADPAPAAPRSKKPTEAQKRRCDELWAAVQAACEAKGVAVSIACNRREVSAWVLSPKRREELRPRLRSGWREAVLGPLLDAVEAEAVGP